MCLVTDNLKLVSYVLRNKRNCENYEDLFQEGVIGLMKAVERFDESRGYKFSTYAVPLIFGQIKLYMRDFEDKRISLSREIRHLARTAEKYDSLDEASKALNISVEKLQKALNDVNNVTNPIWLNDCYGNCNNPIIDTLSDNKLDVNVENKVEVEKALSCLTNEEKELVYMRFYLDLTQGDIANKVNCSQAQVSRHLTKALNKMKNTLNGEEPITNARIKRDYNYKGKLYSITELSQLSDIKFTTIHRRLKEGWSVEKAVETVVTPNGRQPKKAC